MLLDTCGGQKVFSEGINERVREVFLRTYQLWERYSVNVCKSKRESVCVCVGVPICMSGG